MMGEVQDLESSFNAHSQNDQEEIKEKSEERRGFADIEAMREGINLRIENLDWIFSQLKKGKIFVSEKMRLPLPGNSIEITLISSSKGSEEFSVNGKIITSMSMEKEGWYARKPDFSLAEALSPFPVHKITENVLMIEDREKIAKFAIKFDYSSFREEFTQEIEVNAGFHPSLGPLGDISLSQEAVTPPFSPRSFAEFEENIKEFFKIFQALLIGLYKKEPPIKLDLNFRLGEKRREEFFGIRKKIEIIERPDVSFSEIGGQKEAKEELEGISFALKNPELYKKWGTRPPKGILLYGPPGTGKTLLVKALASQAEAQFFHIGVQDIASMWYGRSEKLMQEVFDLAKENEKSIIFFDELDALGRTREESHEASQRILSVLLENLDGLESSENILIVGATNRLEAIDLALRRPGRLDRLIEVHLPDRKEREEIFHIHMEKAEKIAERRLFEELDFPVLIPKTEGMSGADISEIIRRTLEKKVKREGLGEEVSLVTTGDLIKEIESYERRKKSQLGFTK